MYLAIAYLSIEWLIPPLILFSTVNTISISVKNFNLSSIFFKAAFKANQELESILVGLAHKFLNKFSKVLKNINQ